MNHFETFNRRIRLSDKNWEILNKLDQKRNGAYFKVKLKSNLRNKVKASQRNNEVIKITDMSVRKGIKRNNTKIYKDMQQNYRISTRSPRFKFLTNTLLKSVKEDKYYIALYPNHGKPKSKYFLNGREVSKNELRDIMIPSFFTQKELTQDIISPSIDTIIEVK